MVQDGYRDDMDKYAEQSEEVQWQQMRGVADIFRRK